MAEGEEQLLKWWWKDQKGWSECKSFASHNSPAQLLSLQNVQIPDYSQTQADGWRPWHVMTSLWDHSAASPLINQITTSWIPHIKYLKKRERKSSNSVVTVVQCFGMKKLTADIIKIIGSKVVQRSFLLPNLQVMSFNNFWYCNIFKVDYVKFPAHIIQHSTIFFDLDLFFVFPAVKQDCYFFLFWGISDVACTTVSSVCDTVVFCCYFEIQDILWIMGHFCFCKILQKSNRIILGQSNYI